MSGKSIFTSSALRWLESVLEERFGYKFSLQERGPALELKTADSNLVIKLGPLQKVFHLSCSDFPCYRWVASEEGFIGPVGNMLYAPSEVKLPNKLIDIHESGAAIHYDILGLTYWMLTRLEEIGDHDLDEHERFPSTSSHAHRNGYLERPIIDEWLNILGQVIVRVWPGIQLKKNKFQVKVSHDVDSPSQYAFKPWSTIARMMTGHILKRGSLKQFLTAPYVKLTSHNQLVSSDPFNTFNWLMDVSEKNNLKSAFYFICGRTNPNMDGDYELEHPIIRSLIRDIYKRGHEIGLHPSYGTFKSHKAIQDEATRLKRVCNEEGVKQKLFGGRMHYLRWEQPTTLRSWSEAGMDYDSTLGYADRPGFRCGTCYEYPAFDPIKKQMLSLRIRPLIVMECSVIAEGYLGLGSSMDAKEKMLKLKAACIKVGGNFTLLWHNSYFGSSVLKKIYQRVLES